MTENNKKKVVCMACEKTLAESEDEGELREASESHMLTEHPQGYVPVVVGQ